MCDETKRGQNKIDGGIQVVGLLLAKTIVVLSLKVNKKKLFICLLVLTTRFL